MNEFMLLLTSHQSSLYACISALLGGVEGVQDVLQETNVVLLEKAGEYDPARPFVPWALAFARFQTLAWRKRQTRDRLVLDAIPYVAGLRAKGAPIDVAEIVDGGHAVNEERPVEVVEAVLRFLTS